MGNLLDEVKNKILGVKPKHKADEFITREAMLVINAAALQTGLSQTLIVNEALNLWLSLRDLKSVPKITGYEPPSRRRRR